MKKKPPLIAFNKGEFDASTLARADLEGYERGAEVMENIVPLVQGGMRKAPGTEHFGGTAGNADAVLYPFIFSQSDAFGIEIADGVLRFHTRDGTSSIVSAEANISAWTDESDVIPSGGDAPPVYYGLEDNYGPSDYYNDYDYGVGNA